MLRDRLSLALDGAVTLRLLWRTDAADALTEIDRDLVARIGAPLEPGRGALPDLLAAADPEGAERLRDALARRATWSGLTVDLPVAEGAGRVPLVLGGSPVFGPGRAFAGFRGFGTLDLGRLDLGRPGAAAVAPEPAAGPDGATGSGAEPVAAPELDATVAPPFASPAPAAAAIPAAQDAAAPALPGANVVQLRSFQSLLAGRVAALEAEPAEAPARAAAPEAPDGEPALSDELAFQALGDALRARIGAALRPPEPSAPLPEAAAPEAEPPVEAPEPPDAALPHGDLAALLPWPLVVARGGAPLFANAAAAARLGLATPDDVLAAGTTLVADGLDPEAGLGAPGPVTLRRAGAAPVALRARRAPVAWAGAAATLWLLDEPAPPEAATPPEAVAPPEAATPRPDDGPAGDLLDRVDDAVALLDANGLVRRLNRRGETWFGRDTALGQPFTQLLAPESRPAALGLLAEARQGREAPGGPPPRREVLARGGEEPGSPMVLTLGRLGDAGFYLTLRDVTALKRAESERDRTERAKARDAGRVTGLLGKVSHEIRTPLNAILGFAEVMMDERFGPLGNARYRDYLKDIHASGTQVMALVEDLLDLSRIEAGELDLDVAAVDVNRIVAETVAQMQPEAHRERVIMRTSLGGRIPAVLADERSARQIVRNLLSNAVKFNEPGGQVIVSTALSDSGAVLLRVRDTGVGMTDAEIAAAMEPFGGAAAPHPANGNGLGLPLTRALVGANGASMAIRSRPREGTLVEVAFPSAGAGGEARRPA